MSQTTHLVFYSCEQPVRAPQDILHGALTATGAKKCLSAGRTLSEDHGWRALFSDSEEDEDFEFLAQNAPIEEIMTSFVPGRRLNIDLLKSPLVHRIREAIISGLPETLYQPHLPGNLGFNIGWHDIFEASEEIDGHLFGRAFISFDFWGYNVPPSIKEYRNLVLALAPIQEIRREFAKIVGPLQQCVYGNY